MKKTLIINLGNEKDVMESAFFISSMLEAAPHDQIHFLCKANYKSIADIIFGVERVHTIQVEEMNTILNNQLYSDGFALNKMIQDIAPLKEIEWDSVVNYDNSTVSAYLSSSLKKESLLGAEVYKNGNVVTSNNWARYQNFCLDSKERLSINKNIIRHQIAGLKECSSNKRIKLSSEFNQVAAQNFQRIRNNDGVAYRFVGIYLASKTAFSTSLLIDTIRYTESLPDTKIVLVHGGSNQSINLISDLNKEFNNSLISIHADNQALPSVFSNLHLLISDRSYISVLAQAQGLATIEVDRLSDSKFHYSGQVGKSIIIDNGQDTLDLYDIVYSLNHFYGHVYDHDEITTSPIYSIEEDDLGSLISLINGPIDINFEINYHISRSLDYQILGFKSNTRLIEHLKANSSPELLKKFTFENKEVLTSGVKALLATLRSIKTALGTKESMNTFLQNLGKLIEFNTNSSICSVAVGLFEGKIENITNLDPKQNLKLIESYLFELKTDFQQINLFLDQLISQSRSKFIESPTL